LEDRHPNTKKNNKMNTDMGSVSDRKAVSISKVGLIIDKI